MKKQLENKLFNSYPDLFRFNSSTKMHTKRTMLYPIAIGVQCDDGWFNLIDSMCEKLNLIHKTVHISIFIVQIKEKFGQLRCYITYTDEEDKTTKQTVPNNIAWNDIIYSVIDYSCNRSAHVCEICGSTTAETITFECGLIKTVCDNHLKWKRADEKK